MSRVLWIVIGLALLGCERGGLHRLSDAELAQRWEECRSVRSPAPIMVQTCNNVERECQRRARELGNYVC